MAYNKKRAERFKKKSTAELQQIADSGSLASAAARYELNRRNRKG